MKLRQFRAAGHWPTLLAACLYFNFSFMAWVTLGPLMVYIATELTLPIEEQFSLVAIPILTGALFRIPLGSLADHVGAKATGLFAQTVVIAAIACAWIFGLPSKFSVELLGIVLGIAGASFAVALPQASRWYPPRYQGVVMGVAGLGNLGAVLATMTVPWSAEMFGCQNAFGFLLIPLSVTFVFYAVVAKDAPGARRPVNLDSYLALIRDRDCWWFMFHYFIAFGGFVGLANVLPLYFTLQFHASGVAAGIMVGLTVSFGAVSRPVGGYIADRVGGVRTLMGLFAVASLTYFAVAFVPAAPVPGISSGPAVGGSDFLDLSVGAWTAAALLTICVLALGMANGAIFQLLPQRFGREIGMMTGLVGCAGGLGGLFLAEALGLSKGLTDNFASGFIFPSALTALGLLSLYLLKRRWRSTWGAMSQARV